MCSEKYRKVIINNFRKFSRGKYTENISECIKFVTKYRSNLHLKALTKLKMSNTIENDHC